jgi:putative flippase GtrA
MWLAKLALLLRSGAAGALATLTDLAVLACLVHVVELSPRVASVPALALGMTVMFFAQRQLAFRAQGKLFKQAVLFALVQLGGFVLTLGLYELALRSAAVAEQYYLLLRLLVTNVVWLAYSFPLWSLVFAESRELRSKTRRAA